MNVLFVTWDGPQSAYLESLFLPIFVRLAPHGVRFHVLQFTWGDARRIALTRQACEHAGIGYQAVLVWKRPRAVGAMLSALTGANYVKKACFANSIDVVMPRSTLPALATLLALKDLNCSMVFDADGLPLDERVDFAGQSSSSFVHRLLRDVEAQAVRRSDVVLTRSGKAVDILHARAGAGTALDKFFVVTNGRDAEKFNLADATQRAMKRHELGLALDAPMLVYVGSIGKQYCLDEMIRLFTLIHARRANAHWLILTGSPEAVAPVLKNFPQLLDSVTVRSVSPHDVPRYLACGDLGLALRQTSYSMQAVAPIKLGEYLLCGLPVLATSGIGDTEAISVDAGRLMQSLFQGALKDAADWFVDSVLPNREAYRLNSRAAGLNRFSLDSSVASYLNAFESLVLKS